MTVTIDSSAGRERDKLSMRARVAAVGEAISRKISLCIG